LRFNINIIGMSYNLAHNNEGGKSMKRLQALVAAVIITSLMGLGMLAIGVNAALNPNTVAVSNAPGGTSDNVSATSAQAQAQINQLQDLIKQYQNREQQYQAQLNQANAQLQQYQALLVELQRRGLIRINSDGSIQLRRGFGSGDNGG
jgi:TolA-binding protein